MDVKEFDIDLLEYKDNFSKYKNVKSTLVTGSFVSTKKPYITIAIPTFNRHEQLKEAIESALMQDYVNFEYEIIIVDNQPKTEEITETEKIISSYSDRRLYYYVNEKNLGMFGNWNRCIELARGQWVAFLHDDDLLTSDYLNKVYSILKRKRDIGCIASKFNTFTESKTTYSKNSKLDKLINNKSIKEQLDVNTMKISPIDSILWSTNPYGAPTCGALFFKDYVVELGGFNENYFPSGDWYFMFKFNNKYNVYRPTTPTGFYRFSINESLKEKTIHGFVKDIDLFRRYSYKNSKIGKLMYKLFRSEQHAIVLDKIIHQNKSLNLKYEDFNYICEYKRNNLKILIYKVLQRGYWGMKKLTQKFSCN